MNSVVEPFDKLGTSPVETSRTVPWSSLSRLAATCRIRFDRLDHRARFALLLAPILLLEACAGSSRPRYGYDRARGGWKGSSKATVSVPAVPVAAGTREKGLASFYADEFAGKPTASGETFSPSDHTCAHRTYPFNTRLKVTSTASGKATEVRVNDRGPHVDDRILDLSRAAASDIGLDVQGVGEVELEVLP